MSTFNPSFFSERRLCAFDGSNEPQKVPEKTPQLAENKDQKPEVRAQSLIKGADQISKKMDAKINPQARAISLGVQMAALGAKIIDQKLQEAGQVVSAIDGARQNFRDKRQQVLGVIRDAITLIKENYDVEPTKETLDEIQKIGKAANEHAKDDPQYEELKSLYRELKQRMDSHETRGSQSVNTGTSQSVNININTMNRNGNDQSEAKNAPTIAPKTLETPQGWEEKGSTMMYQVREINKKLDNMKNKREEGLVSEGDEKQFRKDMSALQRQRSQIVNQLNAMITDLRKPSQDTNKRALTKEETVAVMQKWLTGNDAGIRVIDKTGLFSNI